MVKGSSFGLRKLPDAISKNKRVPYDEHLFAEAAETRLSTTFLEQGYAGLPVSSSLLTPAACSDAQSSDADAPETLIFSASAKDFVNFFENLFTLNPEKRMSAERALAHAYLRI
eukprot:CAMPEP_0113915198 /NCGR_PEP_ID=MMETSP0780_2-20120614/31026_1 /TAXON_ID=652834 /ORGANISM="Palpitomonas bilix" /LENGTH=113 /DNA_ID=CAMNT_0000913595 /DNA_START=24 /DNA_END=364 /DNA_ORIENTATION=- /assembly_acc=CAM_ASM_000599